MDDDSFLARAIHAPSDDVAALGQGLGQVGHRVGDKVARAAGGGWMFPRHYGSPTSAVFPADSGTPGTSFYSDRFRNVTD